VAHVLLVGIGANFEVSNHWAPLFFEPSEGLPPSKKPLFAPGDVLEFVLVGRTRGNPDWN
jgi:hypothetical protein